MGAASSAALLHFSDTLFAQDIRNPRYQIMPFRLHGNNILPIP